VFSLEEKKGAGGGGIIEKERGDLRGRD